MNAVLLGEYAKMISRYALKYHKYKIMSAVGLVLLSPILPMSLHCMYNIYKFSYRTYYMYAMMNAIQACTCSWVSTPSVMLINGLINVAFDPQTA